MIKVWRFYNIDTGVLLPCEFVSANVADVLASTPPGYAATDLAAHPTCQRVEVIEGAPTLVDWQPPAPPEDAMQTWSWDAAAKRWISAPTLAARALEAKAERMTRLERCDWVAARAFETGQPVPPAWLSYRQALRDITEQPGFPDAITWPTQPTT